MEKPSETKIYSSLCFFKPSLLSLALLILSLVFTFLILGSSPFFVTISILFLSTTFFLRFSKKKIINVDNPPQEGSPTCGSRSLHEQEREQEIAEQVCTKELKTLAECNGAQLNETSHVHEYRVEATDFPSDSESSDDFLPSGNFELSWMCSSYVGQNLVVSESSVSDDDQDGDDLIEISLPMSNSVDVNEVPKKHLQSHLPDYLPESIYRQEGLMELLAEINEANEEENLIEIDLSMDSIKSSSSEIEG